MENYIKIKYFEFFLCIKTKCSEDAAACVVTLNPMSSRVETIL
ncbi:hypothetical protein ACINWC141_1086 [Acinetobacter sp. WC-141]|nr:hypothetical protein ACINWC141_1086 [Acinetobacter sp. WC-141]